MLLWVVQHQLEEKQHSRLKLDDMISNFSEDGTNLKDDRNYSRADTNTLSVQHVKKSHEGCYRCLVKNEIKKNGILSEEAQISVCKFRITCCVDTL